MLQLRGASPPLLDSRDGWLLALLAVVFAAGVLWNIGLPGLYMDAVNPDYYAALLLKGRSGPSWLLPSGSFLPALGAPYHGVQHVYLGLPLFYLFGTSIESLRLFHALFGLGILGATYVLLVRLHAGRWLAFGATACLAVDPTFIYAFRTQLYITMAPMLWWMLGLVLLLRGPRGEAPSRLRLLASGALCGFAFYGYFIYLFIAPPVLALAMSQAPPGRRFRAAALWCLGFLIGTLPYFYGYAAWASTFPDLNALLEAIRQAIASARPEDRAPGLAATVARIWHLVTLAVTGQAVQLLMLSWVKPGPREWLMPILFLAPVVALLLPLRFAPGQALAGRTPGLAIASFVVLGAWFVGRLWAHHYAILLPLLYVGCALLVGQAFMAMRRLLPDAAVRIAVPGIGIAAVGTMLALNVVQNVNVQAKLVATGGVDKYTDAINRVADDARRQAGALYVLQEWGFFMPVTFLASRSVEVATSIDTPAVAAQLCAGQPVYSPYWIDAGVADRIEADRSKLGARIESERTYQRRDGIDVIRVVKFGAPAENSRCPAGKPVGSR